MNETGADGAADRSALGAVIACLATGLDAAELGDTDVAAAADGVGAWPWWLEQPAISNPTTETVAAMRRR